MKVTCPVSSLHNRHAKKVVADVWRHLQERFPDDARILSSIVQTIIPVPPDQARTGTLGECVRLKWQAVGVEHGRGNVTIKLLDSKDLTVGVVAHEFGHAFSSEDDIYERSGPEDEWNSEAAADMHAVRWGLLTCEAIRDRHRRNTEGLQQGVETIGSAWKHHGPPPGGPSFEVYGNWWRLRESDFVFEVDPKPTTTGATLGAVLHLLDGLNDQEIEEVRGRIEAIKNGRARH